MTIMTMMVVVIFVIVSSDDTENEAEAEEADAVNHDEMTGKKNNSNVVREWPILKFEQ